MTTDYRDLTLSASFYGSTTEVPSDVTTVAREQEFARQFKTTRDYLSHILGVNLMMIDYRDCLSRAKAAGLSTEEALSDAAVVREQELTVKFKAAGDLLKDYFLMNLKRLSEIQVEGFKSLEVDEELKKQAEELGYTLHDLLVVYFSIASTFDEMLSNGELTATEEKSYIFEVLFHEGTPLVIKRAAQKDARRFLECMN